LDLYSIAVTVYLSIYMFFIVIQQLSKMY